MVPESSAGTVSEVWILRLSFYSLTIEYQHIAYSLSGIENQCQNFPTHESAYCLHGYKYTDYQYYTLYSFWYYIGLTSLIFIIISNCYIIDTQQNIPSKYVLGNLVLTLQAEMRGYERDLYLII